MNAHDEKETERLLSVNLGYQLLSPTQLVVSGYVEIQISLRCSFMLGQRRIIKIALLVFASHVVENWGQIRLSQPANSDPRAYVDEFASCAGFRTRYTGSGSRLTQRFVSPAHAS